MSSLTRLIFSSLVSTLVVSVTTASGALTAQFYDFGTGPGKTTASTAGFTAVSGGTNRTWSDAADSVNYTDSSAAGTFLTSTQTRSFTDLGSTPHFSITVDLTQVSQNQEFTRFGILALGSGGDTGYAAVITQNNGGATTGLAIRENGLQSGANLVSLTNSNLDDGAALLGDLLTLTLVGEYFGADLKLTFTATDGINTSSINFTDTTPLTGNFAGFGVRSTDVGNPNFVTSFDSFAIGAIPEPSASLLFVGSLSGLLMLRRRKP